mgnify:CR=1 FL=1
MSFDAATSETYSKVRRGGNWGILQKNMEFISSLRKEGKVRSLRIDFVMQLLNYKEAPGAVILAKNFKYEIDFNDIFAELDRGLERRIQIAIIDIEEDVVYYVTRIVEWPETKLKKDGNIIINDPEVKELIDKGYQINSGLKFGTHYRIYNYESKHAPWLIHIVKDGITWLDITRMVRVGHGVNKTIVLAYKKRWISLEWIKP